MTVAIEPELPKVKERPPRNPYSNCNGGGFDGNNTGRGGGDDWQPDPEGEGPAQSVRSMDASVLGMWIFILSELVLFGVLIFAFAWARVTG